MEYGEWNSMEYMEWNGTERACDFPWKYMESVNAKFHFNIVIFHCNVLESNVKIPLS